MGSFYTQIIVREGSAEHCAEVMRSLKRSSFILPSCNEITVVCEQECDNQDIEVLDSVALTLSDRLKCAAVGLVNHDDDLLVLRYFDSGKFIGGLQIGHTPMSLRGSISELRRLLNPSASLFDLFLAFMSPTTFQWRRHAKIVELLGIPPRSIGIGYRYIRDDNLLEEFDKTDLIET